LDLRNIINVWDGGGGHYLRILQNKPEERRLGEEAEVRKQSSSYFHPSIQISLFFFRPQMLCHPSSFILPIISITSFLLPIDFQHNILVGFKPSKSNQNQNHNQKTIVLSPSPSP
jgi:hypothetical protein